MKQKPRVLVFGGTHGNEWTGIYAIRSQAEVLTRKYPQLDLQFILANPEAFALGKRFKDEDLNRAFQFLHESRPASYEHRRARELKALIQAAPCFVIDLHTTTANMGKTLILSDYDPRNLFVAEACARRFPDCRLIGSPDPAGKYLATQSAHNLMIEVGPVANNLLDPICLESTIALLDHILATLSMLPDELHGSVELYEELEDVKYPIGADGELDGYVHPELQGQDFTALKGTFKAFRRFSGEDVSMACSEERFPIFINEAAYYRVNQAFTLCRKIVKAY
jgi:aspartoacylase